MLSSKSLTLDTVAGKVELTKPSDIRVYNQLRSKQITEAGLVDEELRFGNVTGKLFSALILQNVISPQTMIDAIDKGYIDQQNYQDFLPLKNMRDDLAAYCIGALKFSPAALEDLYLNKLVVEREVDGKKIKRTRPAAFPLSAAMALAEHMHAKLVTNKVDVAVIPSYIVALDHLFSTSFDRVNAAMAAKLNDLRDSKYQERSISAEDMSEDEFRASGNRVDAIKGKIEEIKAEIPRVNKVIRDIKDINVDLDKIDLEELDHAPSFKNICMHIKRYVKFAAEYGHYHASLSGYLSGLKQDVHAVIQKHMTHEDIQILEGARNNLKLAEAELEKAEAALQKAEEMMNPRMRESANNAFAVSARANVGSATAVTFGMFGATGKLTSSGSMAFDVVASSVVQVQRSDELRISARQAEEELVRASIAVQNALDVRDAAEAYVESIYERYVEKAGTGKLYRCVQAANDRMEIDESFAMHGAVIDKFVELKHEAATTLAKLCDAHLDKIKHLQFTVNKHANLLVVPHGEGFHGHSPRLGRRSRNASRNTSANVSPAGSPEMGHKPAASLLVPKFK